MRRNVALRPIHGEAVAARRLRVVHRDIGAGQDLDIGVVTERRDADTRRDEDFLGPKVERALKRGQNALGHA